MLTASAVSLPALSAPTLEMSGIHPICTRPPIISFSMSGVPFSGMCTDLIPVACRNFSWLMCDALPMPAEVKLSSPGFDFASATSSFTVFTPRVGGTMRTLGRLASGATPAKSPTVS